MRGPDQSVYTMAANAVLRLIERYEIDPNSVGHLALGTESSTDNAIGAVIVRGLIDQALLARGMPPLARDCEVPEVKHACLGGVYAAKGALRYLASDGVGRTAIVVSADVAEYARGSTGEPTQGAGAVAMWLESSPRLLALDLHTAGSASDYRVVDFRKPFLRFVAQEPGVHGRLQDPPIFNGKYSTNCYIDQTLKSLDHMFTRRGGPRASYLRALTAVFMHRPYHRMPANAWALAYLAALAADGGSELQELGRYCAKAQVELEVVVRELLQPPGATELAQRSDLAAEVYPMSMLVLKVFRETPMYREMVDDKMSLGSPQMMEMGNLYTAALPAWLAGAFDVAVREGRALDNANVLVAGYGSGDAAEAIPARVVEGWEDAASRIRFREDLLGAILLNRPQYEALHAGQVPDGLPQAPPAAFAIDRVGEEVGRHFQDFGIEYYRYAGARS